MTQDDMHIEYTAKRAVREWFASHRPVVTKKAGEIAKARFDGFCEGLCAVGLGMTPTAIHLDCDDAIRHVTDGIGPRPDPVAGQDHSAQKAWDAEVAQFLISRWS